MCYVIGHPSNFDTIDVGTKEYSPSRVYTTHYGGTFKAPGHKLKHKNIVFINPTDTTDKWSKTDLLVVTTEDFTLERGGLYLFKQGAQYRIATCKSVDRIGTFPPIFDGSETFLTHELLGRVIGKMGTSPNVEIF